MALNLSDCLVIGISSRALFDLERENSLFDSEGVEAYRDFQRQHENEVLPKGTAFPLVEALLGLNRLHPEKRLVEVVIMSRNSPDTGLRAFNSIEHYGLDISRAAFSGGKSLASYLDAFNVDLFLSKSESDVQEAIDHGVAAAVLYAPPDEYAPQSDQIRIAFDGDAVLFSDESERVYKSGGLDAFVAHEQAKRDENLPEGPFAKLLKTLAFMQQNFEKRKSPVRIAIVTARASPTHSRVIRTLRDWQVEIDEAFFLGGVGKDQVLKAFRAHIFFDDQELHLNSAAKVVPSGKVPYKRS